MAVGTSPGELRELTEDELTARLRESKEELFNLRFQMATGQLANNRRLRVVRQKSHAFTPCCVNVSWVWLPDPLVRIRNGRQQTEDDAPPTRARSTRLGPRSRAAGARRASATW